MSGVYTVTVASTGSALCPSLYVSSLYSIPLTAWQVNVSTGAVLETYGAATLWADPASQVCVDTTGAVYLPGAIQGAQPLSRVVKFTASGAVIPAYEAFTAPTLTACVVAGAGSSVYGVDYFGSALYQFDSVGDVLSSVSSATLSGPFHGLAHSDVTGYVYTLNADSQIVVFDGDLNAIATVQLNLSSALTADVSRLKTVAVDGAGRLYVGLAGSFTSDSVTHYYAAAALDLAGNVAHVYTAPVAPSSQPASSPWTCNATCTPRCRRVLPSRPQSRSPLSSPHLCRQPLPW